MFQHNRNISFHKANVIETVWFVVSTSFSCLTIKNCNIFCILMLHPSWWAQWQQWNCYVHSNEWYFCVQVCLMTMHFDIQFNDMLRKCINNNESPCFGLIDWSKCDRNASTFCVLWWKSLMIIYHVTRVERFINIMHFENAYGGFLRPTVFTNRSTPLVTLAVQFNELTIPYQQWFQMFVNWFIQENKIVKFFFNTWTKGAH